MSGYGGEREGERERERVASVGQQRRRKGGRRRRNQKKNMNSGICAGCRKKNSIRIFFFPSFSGKSYVFLNQPPLTDELKKTKVV